jgi:ABC-2 type transport system permease protein
MTESPPRSERGFGSGWRVVARKEFSDHLHSGRFTILSLILAVVAAAAVYVAAGAIREVASQTADVPALFLKLFSVTADPVPYPLVVFLLFLGPLLGIMFGFDAISGERSQGTLPRLLAQPIHRDEVILGKFVGGLAVIALLLAALTTFVAGIGIFRLGLIPTPSEISRLVVWLLVAVIYVGFWQALATLTSVTAGRAATSAMIAIGLWLILTLFGGFLFRAVASVFADPADAAGSLAAELRLARISPVTLFEETSGVLLDPSIRVTGVPTFEQVVDMLPSDLSLSQSLSIVWPQIIGLVAMTTALYAIAYVSFMRQEVRA